MVSFRGMILHPPVDLVAGHTGGTFYIRARLRAGACVPADSETLGRRVYRTGHRYGWLNSWPCGLSPRSPDLDGYGLLTCETVFAVGRRPSATHPTSGVGGERKLAGQTGGNGEKLGKPEKF